MKTHIRLTKVTRLPDRPNGDLLPADSHTERGAIVEGYAIKGFYSEPPTIGKHFHVDRYERNGVQIQGMFSTSLVYGLHKKDGYTLITTENSVYRMEELELLQSTGMGDGQVSYQSGSQDE